MRSPLARRTGLLLLALAEAAAAAIALLVTLLPASAQIDDRFPFMEERRRRYQQPYQQQQQQQQQYPQWGSPFGFDQPRQQPADSSRAPPPRRADVTPATKIEVFGDSMADWLAYGLEEAFADTPEIGVLRKLRTNSGLIRVEVRGESYDWPSAAREMLNADKPDYVVMMIGLADRRGIREAIRQQPAKPPAGPKQAQPAAQGVQGQAAAQQAAAPPAQPAAPEKPADAEASPQPSAQDTAQDNDQSNVIAPEAPIAGTVVHEFRSEKWGELYSRRVDEMISVLKSKGVPVFWVGLPSVRGQRATSEMVYLNDLYRARAEKAGISYIDVWDGFVDDSGSYSNYGPDLEGQTRRLRSGDGAHFTRAGARKLAHYVEREIRRVMTANVPVATLPPQEPEPDTKAPPAAAAPGLPPRPAASPVMSLTTPKGAGDALAGANPGRTPTPDSVAARVLVKGEPLEAPAGRADDFAWPRRDIVTATGALPPDPVEPPEPAVAESGTGTGTGAAPATGAAPTKQASNPRPRREPQHQTSGGGWGWFGRQQPYESRPQPRGGFFGGWFGGRGW